MRKASVMSVVLLIIVCSTFANIKTRTLTREDYYLSGPVSSVSYVVYDVETSFGKESYVKSDYYYEASFDEAGRVVTEKQNSEHKGDFYNEEGSFSLAFAPFGNPVQFPPIYSFAVKFDEFFVGYLDSFRRLYALFSGTSPVIDPSFSPLESTRQTEFMYDEFGKLLSVEFYEGSDLDYYQKYSYGDSGLLERVELYGMPLLSGDTSGPHMVTFVAFEYDESQRIKIRYNHNLLRSPYDWETAVLYSYDSQGNVVGVDFYAYGDSSRKVDSVKLSYESERLTSIETFKTQVVTLIYGEDSRLHQVILENNAPYPTLGFVVEYSDKGLVSRFEKYRFSGEWKLAFTEDFSYEFDVYGNWTTLTFYQNKEEMGKVQRVPSLLVNRIITYNE